MGIPVSRVEIFQFRTGAVDGVPYPVRSKTHDYRATSAVRARGAESVAACDVGKLKRRGEVHLIIDKRQNPRIRVLAPAELGETTKDQVRSPGILFSVVDTVFQRFVSSFDAS